MAFGGMHVSMLSAVVVLGGQPWDRCAISRLGVHSYRFDFEMHECGYCMKPMLNFEEWEEIGACCLFAYCLGSDTMSRRVQN